MSGAFRMGHLQLLCFLFRWAGSTASLTLDVGAMGGDTTALQEALAIAGRAHQMHNRIEVLIPPGEFTVLARAFQLHSNPARASDDSAPAAASRTSVIYSLRGAGRGRTVLKLPKGSPAASVLVAHTAGPCDSVLVEHLSVVIENRNTLTVAVDFMASPAGVLQNVDISSMEPVGLGLFLRAGHGHMRAFNVSVKGFSTGIYAGRSKHAAVLSNLEIHGAAEHCLHIDNTGGSVAFVRNLSTVVQHASSVLLAQDAQCVVQSSSMHATGSQPDTLAVQGEGGLKLQHARVEGYGATHSTGHIRTPAGYVSEMITNPEAFFGDQHGLLFPGVAADEQWGTCVEAPREQGQPDLTKLLGRRERVTEMFLHAWNSYMQCALGRDELVDNGQGGCHGEDWLHLGITVVDALDTLLIMGLEPEFEAAEKWVKESLVFDVADVPISLFESAVRVLGGLLSAQELRTDGDRMFLDKAVALGDRLLAAFDKTALPHTTLNLHTLKAPKTQQFAALSEVCGIQLELAQLSRLSCDRKYERAGLSTLESIIATPSPSPLRPIVLNVSDGKFAQGARLSMGAGGDSFYEYLLKLSIIKQSKSFDADYAAAVDAMSKDLIWHSASTGRVYVTDSVHGRASHRFEMLSCFLPGMLALSSQKRAHWTHHLQIGKHLMASCVALFDSQPHGVAPETVVFSAETGEFQAEEKRHLLRPETFESLYMMHQVTGDEQYREHAWRLFQNVEANCKRTHGYSGIADVTAETLQPDGRQHSYFLAETAKYLFLLFSEDGFRVNTSSHVFSTEAHPFKIDKPECNHRHEL